MVMYTMKSAPLGLGGCQEWSLTTEALPGDGDRMTALIHYESQRWKKVNFFAKKTTSLGLCFNMFKPCACPVSLTCIPTQQQAMWRRLLALSCSRNTSDRSLAWSHHAIAKIYAIDHDRAETWNTSRQTARSCLTCTSRSTAASM